MRGGGWGGQHTSHSFQNGVWHKLYTSASIILTLAVSNYLVCFFLYLFIVLLLWETQTPTAASPLPPAVPAGGGKHNTHTQNQNAFLLGPGTGLSPSTHQLPETNKLRQGRSAWEELVPPHPHRNRSERGFPPRRVFVPGACVFQDATEAIAEKQPFSPLGPQCANRGLRTQTLPALAETRGLRSAACPRPRSFVPCPAEPGPWGRRAAGGEGGAARSSRLSAGTQGPASRGPPARGSQGGAKVTQPVSRGRQLP